KTKSSSRTSIMSSHMAASQESKGLRPGLSPTWFGSKTVFWPSTGMYCKTRRPRRNLSAPFLCLATAFRRNEFTPSQHSLTDWSTMNLTGNTIFITGGGSGIGRALAEALHKRGNKVIISGRRKGHLDAVVKANPGIKAIELDIADPDNIKAVAQKLIREHPDLNVLINNAGIMEPDQAAGIIDEKLLASTVTTNLLGPIRLTSALVDQLKSRRGIILYNTSVLGFVPLAVTAVYSATKAALHSYALSQRFL